MWVASTRCNWSGISEGKDVNANLDRRWVRPVATGRAVAKTRDGVASRGADEAHSLVGLGRADRSRERLWRGHRDAPQSVGQLVGERDLAVVVQVLGEEAHERHGRAEEGIALRDHLASLQQELA